MHLSKSFVAGMGVVLLFLLFAFVTSEAQCIARARRLIREMERPIPANLRPEDVCDWGPAAPPGPQEDQRPVWSPVPGAGGQADMPRRQPIIGRRGIG